MTRIPIWEIGLLGLNIISDGDFPNKKIFDVIYLMFLFMGFWKKSLSGSVFVGLYCSASVRRVSFYTVDEPDDLPLFNVFS